MLAASSNYTVLSPALDAAAAGQRTSMAVGGGDSLHAAGEAAHVHWRLAVNLRAVTQLTAAIVSPAFDAASGGQCTCMVAAGGDGNGCCALRAL